MTHFSLDVDTRKGSDPQWLRVGAVVGRLVNDWSFRSDLVVNMGETISHEMPALFNPASAEIEINTTKAFGINYDPALVGDLSKRTAQLEHPVACGAIYHEALHARFSRFSLEKAFDEIPEIEYKALHLLEEGRIEAWGVKQMPDNQIFLRSSALELAIGDIDSLAEKLNSVRGAAFVAGLTLARVDAGVLDEREVERVRELLIPILGEDTIAKLREVWIEAQAYANHSDATGLYPLAKRWVEIVEEAREQAGEPEQGEGEPQGGEGSGDESGEGSGEPTPGKGSGQELADAIREALEEAREFVKIATQMSAFDAMDDEEAKQEAEERAKDSKQRTQNRAVAVDVFGQGSGPSPSNKTQSKLIEKRQPTSDERIAAVKVSQLLEKAKYRERSQTEIRSVIPQGRLRSRAMVQNAAYKSIGIHQQAEAWERTVRRHTDDPTLKIGVMVDISGSMSMAMQPLATTAWVLSEAGRRVQAQTAMVYYGQDVFATLKPGQHLHEVNVYSAPDGTEEFDKAFKALDGSLELLHSDGARLLVVVSDGYYRHEQTESCYQWLDACKRSGVAVLWITFGGMTNERKLTAHGANVVDVANEKGLGKVAELIGQTAADALTNIGKRNS